MNKILTITLLLTTVFFNGFSQDAREKMDRFLQVLDKYYVEDVDSDTLTEIAIKSMLKELDPHSIYYSAKDLIKANEPLEGKFEGVGITFNILRDTIVVVNTIIGGPSERVGLLAGDKIVKINDEEVAGIGMKNAGVVKRLRGEKGTEVLVFIQRRGEDNLLEFNIVRDKIPLYAVHSKYMIDDETGYVKLTKFSATSTKEVVEAIKELQDKGMVNLILDLTGNTGGYLDQAKKLSDQFLDGDKMIVFTEGRSYPKSESKATHSGIFEEGKLVVMVNQNSASASEIVAGAIQDWDRGAVVGRRTYGKGLVQKPYYLPDQSAVRLTVAHYYTPSGRFIQKPYDKADEDYYKEVINRYESGELVDAALIDFPDSLKYTTANGRTVYGGGGIMPDVFVPIDTLINSKFFNTVFRKGYMNRFALNYVDHNRDFLNANYADEYEFRDKFKMSDDIMEEFYAFTEKQGVEKGDEDFSNSLERMSTQLKAMIAQNLWNSNGFWVVYNEVDPIFKKAYEVIQNKKAYKKLGLLEH